MARGFHCDVAVTRPSRWGKPYAVDRPGKEPRALYIVKTLGEALRGYQEHLARHPELVKLARKELRGLALGCVCTMDLTGKGEIVCHAQILARVADGADLPIIPVTPVIHVDFKRRRRR